MSIHRTDLTSGLLGACCVALVAGGAACSPTSGTPNAPASESTVELHPRLTHYVEQVELAAAQVPADRRESLDALAEFIQAKRRRGEPVKLVFICTHNSRRSHMSQLWASVAAAHYGVSGVEAYSGGTESTAFNPRAVAAMQRAGFEISAPDRTADNPRYEVTYSPSGPKLESFSKKFSEPPNPSRDFAAIMTCSQADASCPFVRGAELRLAIPYVDPKVSDGTAQEAATYDERARQIATEMFYLFSRVGA